MNDEQIGSGLLNTITNNLPFELHAPEYNFLGPGTKLNKTLRRSDVVINTLTKPLENMIFDIQIIQRQKIYGYLIKFYKKKHGIELRLMMAKRAFALATTDGMWLKTKLRMCVDIEPGLSF